MELRSEGLGDVNVFSGVEAWCSAKNREQLVVGELGTWGLQDYCERFSMQNSS